MPNENAIVINGFHVKELRCKNDSCRTLFGYEQMRIGVLIFLCRSCGEKSIFNVQYKSMGKPLIDKLQIRFGKGGEK